MVQRCFTFTQVNSGRPEQVFPLLCPVREHEWLDGWSANIVHSESGVAEENCVFTTPFSDSTETIWQVIHYDEDRWEIGFVRWTTGQNTVRIDIALRPMENGRTASAISYRYTALSSEQEAYLSNGLEQDFLASMNWWEKAINHFLTTGKCLMRETT